jgi:hypothetical protein
MSKDSFLSICRNQTLIRELSEFLSEAPEYVCVAGRQHRRFAAGDFYLSKSDEFIQFRTGALKIKVIAGTWHRTTHRFVVRGREGGVLLKPSRKNELWLRRQKFRWRCESEVSRRWKLIQSGFAPGPAGGGAFLRLILQAQGRLFVAVAAADDENVHAEAVVAQLLSLWNRVEQKGRAVRGGILVLSDQLALSAGRLVNELSAAVRIFRFPEMAEIKIPSAGPIPLLWPSQKSREELRNLSAKLCLPEEVQAGIRNGKEWSFEYLGVPFAVFSTDEECWRLPLQENLPFPDGPAARHQVREECHRVRELRRACNRFRRDPLYQLYGERWLESLILRDPKALDPELRSSPIYSQVPAYLSRRRVIDVVGVTESGRLVVIEVKVHKSIDLLLQGLAYWRIVLQAQQHDAFRGNGYFESLQISVEPPLLFCVTPLLSLHADQRLFARHLQPEVEAYLIGINNGWRGGIKVLRKEKL